MSKKKNRIFAFTSSSSSCSEEKLKKALLKVLKIHFDKGIGKNKKYY